MNVLAVALADEDQRFVKGYPPRGAWLFLEPDLETSRLASLVDGTDQLVYRDQRVEPVDWQDGADACLVRADLGQESSLRRLLTDIRPAGIPTVVHGPLPTSWGDRPPAWAGSYVVGDIVNAWPRVRADLLESAPAPAYRADPEPRYVPARRPFGRWPEMNTGQQVTSFVVGCSCPEPLRPLCTCHAYYGDRLHVRPREEVIGEIISLPHKHVRLLDEDVARFPEYYHRLFRDLWNYRRHWSVNAGIGLFRHPRLIRLLAKAGTKLVMLDDSFLTAHIARATGDPGVTRSLYRRVKLLQSRRMLVGARLSLSLDPERRLDWDAVAEVLKRIDADFADVRFYRAGRDGGLEPVPVLYQPMVDPRDPAWVRYRFNSMGAIVDRLVRRPRRTGFYSTVRYLLPYSMAYRQNYLERISRP